MAYAFQFIAYLRTAKRFLAPLGLTSAGFAYGAMSLTHQAGVNDVPHLLVAGLMAANFVLLIGFTIPRDRF
jgi:hypothetical protein